MSSQEHTSHGHGTQGAGLVMAGFGTLWWLAGAGALGGGPGAAATIVGMVIGIALVVTVRRRLSREGEQERFERHARAFTVINIAQGFGIAVIIVVANMNDAAAWIPALIAIIVGIHFLPLARLFETPEYQWIGALMIVTGLAGAAVAGSGAAADTVLAVVGLACACILWTFVAVLFGRQRAGSTTPGGAVPPPGDRT